MKKTLLIFTILFGNFLLVNAQNNCSTALPVTPGITSVGTISGTLVDGCGEAFLAANSEWFAYTSSVNGIVTITSDLPQNDGVTNSDDTYLNVYSGSCGTLTCLGNNDDFGTGYLSSLSFVVQIGETYYIEWLNQWADEGFDFELSETVITCPANFTPPFTENFTNTNSILICWDFYDEDGDGFNWDVVDYDIDGNSIPDGNPCLRSASYDNDLFNPLTPDNWIVSYPVDLTSFSSGDLIQLSWLARGTDAAYANENYSVYVGNSNTTASLLTSPISFTEIIGQNGGAGVFAAKTLNISSFYGQNVYIAFRHYNSTDEFELNIDDVAVSVTLSSEDFAKNKFNVYPSPASNIVNISSEYGLVNTIKIVDINGRLVKEVKANNATNTEINVSDLKAGIYMITIESIEGSVVKKFIKQ